MKRYILILAAFIMCICLAGCKRDDTTTPPESSAPAISQAETPQPSSIGLDETPSESIPPILDLFDAEYILEDSEFEGLEKPEGYQPDDADRDSLIMMVNTLRVTKDALVELEALEAEDSEYLLNAKAPITTLMAGIKDAHETGMMLEHSDELEEFHRLYMSVLILNYNGADLMAQAMDGDDETLAEEAYALFERSERQYDLLIDYANLLLGEPIPTNTATDSPEPTS